MAPAPLGQGAHLSSFELLLPFYLKSVGPICVGPFLCHRSVPTPLPMPPNLDHGSYTSFEIEWIASFYFILLQIVLAIDYFALPYTFWNNFVCIYKRPSWGFHSRWVEPVYQSGENWYLYDVDSSNP